MDGVLVLAMILLLVASGYVAGRVHGQYGYRMGYRLGYRQGFADADRGQDAQASPSPPARTPHARAAAGSGGLIDLGTFMRGTRGEAAANILARHRARTRPASPEADR